MTDFNVIENKIGSAKKYLVLLERYKSYSDSVIQSDTTLRGAVERYLYLAVQSTLELAGAYIAFRNLRKPTVYSENFDILREAGVIPSDLAERLVRMAGFRNVISHDYERLNFGRVYDVLQNRLGDIEEFVKIIETKHS